ncbi:MAG: hypothetical protein ACRDID_06300 [Ktedonobacterales bacterium]
MLTAFLFPLAVVGIWAVVFVTALLVFRKGMHERDAETAEYIKDEDESTTDAGWKALTPLTPGPHSSTPLT